MVRDDPAISPRDLCTRIRAEFGVRYTPAGVKKMLKKQLGFFYAGFAFRPTAPAHWSEAGA